MWCVSILAGLCIKIKRGALRTNHILTPLCKDSYLIGHDEARRVGGECVLSQSAYGSLLEFLSSSLGAGKAMIESKECPPQFPVFKKGDRH